MLAKVSLTLLNVSIKLNLVYITILIEQKERFILAIWPKRVRFNCIDSVSYTHLDVYKRQGQLRDRSVHIKHPYSDIVIVYSDGLLAGWTTRDKLDDLEDRVSIDIKSLNPMPDSFSFKQTCAHLSEHGGFYDGEFWECAGCQQRLVFNDKV